MPAAFDIQLAGHLWTLSASRRCRRPNSGADQQGKQSDSPAQYPMVIPQHACHVRASDGSGRDHGVTSM